MNEEYDVFISYNHKSKNQVENLYNVLSKQYNLNIWIDFKRLKIGDNLSIALNDGLKKSKVVIACITKSYSQSKSCQNELILASEHKKPLLIIALEEVKLKDIPEISFYISNLNRCNLYKVEEKDKNIWSSKKFLDEVITTLEEIMKIDLLSYENLNNFSSISENTHANFSMEDIGCRNNTKWFDALPLIEIMDWSFLISIPSEDQKISK